jgi:hypothetical protein
MFKTLIINPFSKRLLFIFLKFSDNTLDCTLWDALAVNFLDAYNNREDFGPFVIILKHARIKEAQGLFVVCYPLST